MGRGPGDVRHNPLSLGNFSSGQAYLPRSPTQNPQLEILMSTTRRALVAALAVLSLAFVPGALSAQDHDQGSDGAATFGEDFPHGVTFWTRREPVGCWLCEPAIDFNFGRYQRTGDVAEDVSENAIRLHTQFGTGFRHFALAVDLLWIPSITKVSPDNFTLVAQYEPISQQQRLYANVGLGLIAGREQTAGENGFSPWATATIAYRSKIHDIAPFVQVGRVLNGDNREFEFLFGVAHPIAPYRMHGLH